MTRRVMLAGAATGAAALAVRQLAGPGAAQAADGDIVTVGSSFEGTTTTAIRNTTNANPVLQGATKTGTGVWGVSDSGTGVEGFSTTGSGVYAESDQWIGVIGKSSGTAFPAIGVLGESNDAAGQGVFGQSESGTGVMGTSTSGVAVVAKANGPDAVALATQGPVQFSSAGRGTIPAKASSGTVQSPVPLDAERTKILVTLLDTGDDGSKKKHGKPSWKTPVWLSHVELDPEEGTFDVVLSGPTREEIGFSYLVIS